MKRRTKTLGDRLGVDWGVIPASEFEFGVAHELAEHGDVLGTGARGELNAAKTALAHLREHPDYYSVVTRAFHEPGPLSGASDTDEPSRPHTGWIVLALATVGLVLWWRSTTSDPTAKGSVA